MQQPASAAKELTDLFQFNIPERWSIAHLYQAILNEEKHLPRIDFITTLAGYIHWLLTGNKAIGIGDASGCSQLMKQQKITMQQWSSSLMNNLVHRDYPWSLKIFFLSIYLWRTSREINRGWSKNSRSITKSAARYSGLSTRG